MEGTTAQISTQLEHPLTEWRGEGDNEQRVGGGKQRSGGEGLGARGGKGGWSGNKEGLETRGDLKDNWQALFNLQRSTKILGWILEFITQ